MTPLLHFVFFLLLLVPLPSTPIITTKSGCPARCGNVSIPYPFGVGSDCSLNASFNITCQTSKNVDKPYLKIDDNAIEVVDITFDNPPQIRIKYPYLLSASCYNLSNHKNGRITWGSRIDLEKTSYTISPENWLTGIGCDDFVAAVAVAGIEKRYYRDACVGFCADPTNPLTDGGKGECPNNGDGNSVGEGCCRIPISRGTSYLAAGLEDMSAFWNRARSFPCSYAIVKEKGMPTEPGHTYNFSVLKSNSTALLQSDYQPVVRLEWRMGAQNCSQTPRNSSFACQENSDCVDFDVDIGGYFCSCSQGYQGNPYVHQGCRDIDECDKNPCAEYSHCINTLGSYQCKCLRGYTGDGKLSGTGCTKNSNMIKIVVIGLSSTLGILLLFLIWSWLSKVLRKRKNRKRKEDLFKNLLFQQEANNDTFGKTKLFTAKELEKATDNFNESRICGKGGQGIVYKGMLSDGMIVAIKKLKQVDDNQVDQFINEVVILSQINHKNVVKLLGCCFATEVPLLVYEFLPNGTLFDLIRCPNVDFPVTWNMRLKIAADIAGAIAYLHSASSTPIYHRDVKSTNILLDEKNIVKVSDFGTSKLVEVDQTHLTTLVKGTFGYLDPEYFQTGQYTDKSDVYSFGVVLIELLTGQQPISLERSEVERNLVALFLASMEANNLDAILDSIVFEQGAKDEVMTVARLARRCLNYMGRMRPTMKEVTTELESLRLLRMPSTIIDEVDEARAYEVNPMMISDIEDTWTYSDHSVEGSSSDTHPLMVMGV